MRWRLAVLGAGLAAMCAPAVAAASPAAGVTAAAPAAAAETASGQAAAGAGQRVSVAITGLSPQIARPGQRLTVQGTVSNGTSAPVTGLSVQLRSSASPFISRGSLAEYTAGTLLADLPVPGTRVRLRGGLAPGATRPWTVTLPVASIGMTAFGVYPLAAEALSGGLPLTTDRTFLPFWPGPAAAGLAGRLQVAWIWPLTGPPEQSACSLVDNALVDNKLASSLTAHGRLGSLLAAGSASAAAADDLTWAIDPSLLSSAAAMTKSYRTGGTATCTGATPEKASTAARAWLALLQQVTAQQDFFVTPYADVDMAALAHSGMDTDIQRAYTEGRSTAQAILGAAQRPVPPVSSGTQGSASAPAASGIAWPADGIADYGLLGSLAVNGVSTVVLSSTMMPPVTTQDFTPSAITLTPDGVGAELHVALADDTLTQLLAAVPSAAAARAAGPAGAGQKFSAQQRFLAETAMIAAEAPALRRSVVIAPPRTWDPAPGVASALLADTASAPWLQPTTLNSLVAAGSPAGQVARQQPPQQDASPLELSRSLLSALNSVKARIGLQASITNAGPSYLSTAVAAVESSAWRGDQAQAARLLAQLSGYISAQEQKVSIVRGGLDTLTGNSGSVPVSINNKLDRPVTVRLRVQAPPGRIIVAAQNRPITIGRHQQRTIAVPVKALVSGSTVLRLSLLTPDGQALPGRPAEETVDATHVGTLALVIIAIASAVFIIGTASRAIRRRNQRKAAPPDEPRVPPDGGANSADGAAPPGEADTVVQEAVRHDTPQEPDEYASAPGRTDRT